MKILKILLTALTCHAFPLCSADLQAAGPFLKPVPGLVLDSGILLKPYITIYDYVEIENSREVTTRSTTEAAMHLRSADPSQGIPIEVMARVELLNSRNFEQFEIRLAPALGTQSGRARIWLWRSGTAAAGLAGWDDLTLPRVLNGQVSGMGYPLVQDAVSFTSDAIELDILNALDAAKATKGDLILVENLDQPEGTPERFARVLALKDKSEVFLREFAQGRKGFKTGVYQTRAPEGNLVIFPKVVSQPGSEDADGSTQTNISLKVGGSRIQFGLRSLFVRGTRADGPTLPETRWGHTVPQTLSFKASPATLPAGATLKIYKGKSLVRSLALTAGASFDLTGIEDIRARAFTSSNQYELLMIISWGGRDYGFLELVQGQQPTVRPIPQGSSLPY